MLNHVTQHHREPAAAAADRHAGRIVPAVILDVGERNLFRLILAARVEAQQLDCDITALVLFGQRLKGVVPSGSRELFVVLCHGSSILQTATFAAGPEVPTDDRVLQAAELGISALAPKRLSTHGGRMEDVADWPGPEKGRLGRIFAGAGGLPGSTPWSVVA